MKICGTWMFQLMVCICLLCCHDEERNIVLLSDRLFAGYLGHFSLTIAAEALNNAK